MADAVTTQVLQDGEHLYVAKFTNISDGAGEDKVTKVDVSALNPNSHGLACIGMKISKLYAQTDDMGVDIYWVGDPTPANDALCVTLPKGWSGHVTHRSSRHSSLHSSIRQWRRWNGDDSRGNDGG